MSGGLLGFLGFGRKEKPSLTQAFRELPSAESAPLYGDLRSLASKRIRGEGLGFGEDFLNKATNPAIENIDANFRNRTLPTLSSEQSKRGIARSSIATDQIGQADLQRNRDINELVSRFFVLNEQQKKADQTEGINLGNTLNTQYLNQGNTAAEAFNAAERGNTERTVARANMNNANALARQNQTLQAAGALTGDFFGGDFGQNMLSKLGLGGVVRPNSSKLLLGNDELDSFMKFYKMMKGGV